MKKIKLMTPIQIIVIIIYIFIIILSAVIFLKINYNKREQQRLESQRLEALKEEVQEKVNKKINSNTNINNNDNENISNNTNVRNNINENNTNLDDDFEDGTQVLDDGTIYYSDELFMKAPDENHIRTDEGISYVDNELLVYFGKDVKRERVQEIVNEVGAKIVGAIQVVNEYQLEFGDNSYSKSELEELGKKLEEYEDVDSTNLNLAMRMSPDF